MFEHASHAVGATMRARGLRRRTTWTEQRLWKELRKLDANFRRQAPIGRYLGDFAAHGPSLIIEVDGAIHERLPNVAARDAERQRWLEGEGYSVLRFTNEQVRNELQECVETVRCHLALLLDGGGLGGGEATEARREALVGADALSRSAIISTDTPPSPTLPPSRRKGA